MKLRDQCVLVTGAASGMGRALCLELGRAGARLGLLDCNAAGLASLVQRLQVAGVSCASVVVDVRQRAELRAAVSTLEHELGPAGLLVACAGITAATLLHALAVEETEDLLHVNMLGVVHAIEAVLPGMLRRQCGHIVALSSLAGYRGMPFSAGYCASKAALGTFLESLRPALRKRGIYVTTVFPGFVRTPLMEKAAIQVPVPMLEPEEAARLIMKAIRRRCRIYAFPWSTWLIVGLLGWLPAAWFDWCMARAAARVPNVPY